MFDLLVDEWGADMYAEDSEGLTPLRLAVVLGSHPMVRHGLKRRATVRYRFGPLTMYTLPLRGIDTEGVVGSRSVMGMIPDASAANDTHRMLLDTFMNGFIFKLFQAKWDKWARHFWLYDSANLAGLALCLSILASPTLFGYGTVSEAVINSRALPMGTLMLTAVYVLKEVLQLLSEVRADLNKLNQGGVVGKFKYFNSWVVSRLDEMLLAISSSVACFSVLGGASAAEAHATSATRIALAVAQLMTWYQVFINFFIPFEQFGIFVIIVQRMTTSDMVVWIIISMPIIATLAIGANAVSEDSAVPPFGWLSSQHSWASIYDTMEAFFILVFVGEMKDVSGGRPVDTNTSYYQRSARVADLNPLGEQDHFPTVRISTGHNMGEGVVFLFFYVALVVMVVLVLINLLIASTLHGTRYEPTHPRRK